MQHIHGFMMDHIDYFLEHPLMFLAFIAGIFLAFGCIAFTVIGIITGGIAFPTWKIHSLTEDLISKLFPKKEEKPRRSRKGWTWDDDKKTYVSNNNSWYEEQEREHEESTQRMWDEHYYRSSWEDDHDNGWY